MNLFSKLLVGLALTVTALVANAAASINGASIPTLTSIVDASNNTWTLVSGVVQENGVAVGTTSGITQVLELNSVFYAYNGTTAVWYVLSGTTWSVTTDPRVISANNTSITPGSTAVVVDSTKAVWSLPTTKIAYRYGADAYFNTNTVIILYYNSTIYTENTSNIWYSWTGSKWLQVAGDPRPHVVQSINYTSPACPQTNPTCVPTEVGSTPVTFAANTIAGDTIWVAATVSDHAVIHTISVTDSQGNTYVPLVQVNDSAPGAQTVAEFYATNIIGGSDTVTVNYTGQIDNYKGVVAVEIGGVGTSSIVGHNEHIQDGNILAGASNVTSNPITVTAAQAPALILGLTMDTYGGASDIGGSGNCAIPADTGFTQLAQLWSWSPVGNPACYTATLESGSILVPGSSQATFTTTYLTIDTYITVTAAFH